MRKAIDGLASIVQNNFKLDPFSNLLFLFCGHKRNRLKALYWGDDGFVLLYKRLENGRLSLVGTRPPTVDEFNQYSLYYKRRLSMTPGLTGMWQVSGRSSITDFDEVVKLDLEYIDNWSLGLDIKILFMTVYTVLFRRGAV